jgi:hypothetical protein
MFNNRTGPLYTAIVMFHRFFARRSMTKHDVNLTALACVFLAGKVEEIFVKIQAIVHSYLVNVEMVPPSEVSERSEVCGMAPACLLRILL